MPLNNKMKENNKIEKLILILSFVLVIAFPYLTYLFSINKDYKSELSGSEEKVELSFENLDDYILQNFPGRENLIKTKNQLLYSLFDVSPNVNITKIGNTLLSTETINYYLHGLYNVEDEEIDNLARKFNTFKEYCRKNNKKLAVILTPCKARYYEGKFPFVDDIINLYDKKSIDVDKKVQNVEYNAETLKKEIRPVDKLKIKLKEYNINFFDSIDYIDNHKEKFLGGEVPLFYNSGHHWSIYKGNLLGIDFHDYLRKTLDIKIPLLSVKASPSDIAIYPDSDLFDVLNVYEKPNEKFYESVVKYENYDIGETNFLVQGGSFLGALLIPQITVSPFGEVTHIENKSMFMNRYQDLISFDSYDEINSKYNLLKVCKEADVYIFEIHELNVYNATFGLLDYLIEHMGEI